MIERILEPEAMDSADEAREYDLMDHVAVNARFAADLLAAVTRAGCDPWSRGFVIDVGAGTARIPIELCRQEPLSRVVGVDLAREMLIVGRKNVADAALASRIALLQASVVALPFHDGCAPLIASNSLIHHVPDSAAALRDMCRVVSTGGIVFVRDLFRPESRAELDRLVGVHATDATPGQRQLLADSLHAALTVEEVRGIVRTLPLDAVSVEATSDRHWTLAARRR